MYQVQAELDGAVVAEAMCRNMDECSSWADEVREKNGMDVKITIRRENDGKRAAV